MARGRSTRRGAIPTASSLPGRNISLPISLRALSPVVGVNRAIRLVEDRRRFSFTKLARPALAIPRSASRLVVKPSFRISLPKSVMFANPLRVSLCVKRERRRQVLFAKGVGGGRGKKRRPRRNEFSDVSCKR